MRKAARIWAMRWAGLWAAERVWAELRFRMVCVATDIVPPRDELVAAGPVSWLTLQRACAAFPGFCPSGFCGCTALSAYSYGVVADLHRASRHPATCCYCELTLTYQLKGEVVWRDPPVHRWRQGSETQPACRRKRYGGSSPPAVCSSQNDSPAHRPLRSRHAS